MIRVVPVHSEPRKAKAAADARRRPGAKISSVSTSCKYGRMKINSLLFGDR